MPAPSQSSPAARIVMAFRSEAVKDGTVLVAAAEGVEALCRPFRFDLDLVSEEPHLDLAALLRADARLTMNRSTTLADGRSVGFDYDYHGTLASIRQIGRAGARGIRYRVVLYSHLWRLSRSRRSRIYTDKTVPDLLRVVLDGAGIAFEMKIADEKAYPINPYMVQYEETDLDFITRWMEQVGICHYYDATGDRGTLVLTDHTGGYAPLGADRRVEYSESTHAGLGSSESPHIVRLEVEDIPVPQRVQLKEYNYESPGNELLFEAEVDPHGEGVWYEYNSNFRTEGEGRFLTNVRRDYWRGRARRLYGETDHRGFQCGRTFTPVRHFNAEVSDHDFVLIEVRHKLDQESGAEVASNGSYSCSFTAMPADLAYRPERETPWPSIHGVVHGRVAGGALTYAEIDSMGRYKIDVDYDLNDQTIAKVRMAQPSVGENAGMHFPLRKDTEVLLGHIDGDPDKPVILGAVHDASKPNIVSKASDPLGTISRLQSQGGNVMEMQDDGPHKSLVMANGNLNTVQMFGRACYTHPVDGSSAENGARPPAAARQGPVGLRTPSPQPAVAQAPDPAAADGASSANYPDTGVNYAISPSLLVNPGDEIQLHVYKAQPGYIYVWFAKQMTTADEDTSIYIDGATGNANSEQITKSDLNHDDVQMTQAEKDVLKIFAVCSMTADPLSNVLDEAVFKFDIPQDSQNWAWDFNCIPYKWDAGKNGWVRDLDVRQFSTTVNCNQDVNHPLIQQFFTQLDLLPLDTSARGVARQIKDPVTGENLSKAHVTREFKDFYRTRINPVVDTKYTSSGIPDSSADLGMMADQSTSGNPQLPLLQKLPVESVDIDFANYEANYGGTQTISIGRNIELSYGDSWSKSYGDSYSWGRGDSYEMTLKGNSFSYHFSDHDEVAWAKGTVRSFSFGDTSKSYSYVDNEESYSKVTGTSTSKSTCGVQNSEEYIGVSSSVSVVGVSNSDENIGAKHELSTTVTSVSLAFGGPQFELSVNGPKVSIEGAVSLSVEIAAKIEIELSLAVSIAGSVKLEIEGGPTYELGTWKGKWFVKKDEMAALETKLTALVTDTAAAAKQDVGAAINATAIELAQGSAEMKSVATSLSTGFAAYL